MRILATLEEGGQRLVVREKDDGGTEVLLGNVVLLSSAALETERAFGRLAPGARRVVVGGLGMGATLAGVLEVAAPDAAIVVVEKLGAIARLLRGPLAHLAPAGALDDPRVTLEQADVVDALSRARDLDAILLDVDNGPDWASFRTNARLYAPQGLAIARAALAPGGILAVWSGYPADAFLGKLRAAGFAPSLVPLTERGKVRARAYVGRNSIAC